MVCEVKVNALKTMREAEVIDDSRKIINEALFNKYNKGLTEIAISRYGLETNGQMLFYKSSKDVKHEGTSRYWRDSIETVDRAEPNEPLFQQLQVLKTNYDQINTLAKNSINPELSKVITLEFNSAYDENAVNLDIVQNGITVGNVNYSVNNNIATIEAIEINPAYKRQGIATKVYEQLAASLNRSDIALRSGKLNDNSKGVWESLVNKGLAREISQDQYEYGVNTQAQPGEQLRLFQLGSVPNANEAIKELDDYLLNFMKQFGVRSKQFDTLKDKLGIDALGVTDVINKLIWVTKNRKEDTVPEEVGHIVTMLMGETNPIMKDLLDNIELWSEYPAIKAQYMPIYDNEKQVKIEAVGKLIAKSLVSNYKAYGLDKSLIQKALDFIENLIEQIIDSFSLFEKMRYSDKIADHIALNILAGNTDYIADLTTDSEKLDYEKAINQNPLAKSIVNRYGKIGAQLTGSLAIAGANEVIYRPSTEPIHDIDFVVETQEDYNNILDQLEKDGAVPVHYGWSNKQKRYVTYAYFIPEKGLTVEVLERDFNRGNGWATDFILRNKDGEVVPRTTENCIAVDFFYYDNKVKRNNTIFSNVADIYFGKISLGKAGDNERLFTRPKDQKDYQLSRPNAIYNNLPEFTYYQLNDTQNTNTLNINLNTVNDSISKETVDINHQSVPTFNLNLNELNNTASKEVGEVMARKLAAKMNADFNVITPEQAQEILRNSSKPYMGEPAFFFGNTVYFIAGNVNANTVLHEFSHPFVRAIRKSNPQLFENLFAELKGTAEGQAIIDHVKKLYPELEEDTPLFKEECVVYGLQLDAVNKLNKKIATEGFQSFMNKLLASLKQLLRGVFGTAVKVKDLSSTTTISDLSNMLLSDEELDLGDTLTDLTEEDIVMYYKDVVERAEELIKYTSPENVQDIVNQVYSNASSVVKRAREFNTGKDTLNKVMLQRALLKEGTTELLPAAQRSLRSFQDINPINNLSTEDIADTADLSEEKLTELATIKAVALVNSIDRIKNSSINTLNEIKVIDQNPSLINNRNVVALLGLYNSTANSWIDLISEINKILENTPINTGNPFYQTLNEVLNNSQMIITKIAEVYKKNNVKFFVEITGYMTKFVKEQLNTNLKTALKNLPKDEIESAVDNLYNKIIDGTITDADLNVLYEKGVPKDVLNRFIEDYNIYNINEERISDILSGKTKDVSWFNRWLESYSSSNDPIVGSLAMYIQNEKTDVENEVWYKSQKFRTVLSNLLPQVNFSKLNPQQIRNMVAFKDTVFYIDKQTGKPVPKEVWTLLNKFGNGWRFERDNLEYEYAMAKDSGDKAKTADALMKLREFNKAYMWQEYVPEFYEKDDIFNSEMGKLAYLEKKKAYDNFINVQNQFTKELERFENYNSIDAAFRTYMQLYSLYNEDGTLKVDDPANGVYDKSIAELLIQHRNDTSKYYEWVPIANSLSTAYNEFVTELESKKIKRNTPEFEKELRKWEKQNIKIKYTDAFYERRTILLNRLQEIQEKMKASMNLKFNIGDAYKSISDLIYTFRDEFGQPDANLLGETRLKKIRDIEQDIIDFRAQFDYKTGLPTEDADMLYFLLDKSKTAKLSSDEAKALNDLIQKQKDAGIDVDLVDEMSEIFASLSELSSKIPTEYYMDTINMYLSKYNIAEISDTNVDDFINSDDFDQLLDRDAELRKWFAMNHVVIKKEIKGEQVEKYRRTSANSISTPNEGKYFQTTKIIDNETGEEVVLLGIPNARHSIRSVKNEFRTIPRDGKRQDYVGKYVDNKGEFLPREYDPTNRYSAADSRFMNDQYNKLKAEPNSPEFRLLEAITDHHLEMQKDASNYGKLYLDLPRYAIKSGDFYQTLQKAELGDLSKNAKEWFKQKFGKSTQDYLNDFNYNPDNNLVNTDLNGDEISFVPVTGIFNIDAETVDADIFNSIFRYSLSLQTQKQLNKSLPLMNSIMSTLEDPKNQPKNLEKKSKQLRNAKTKVREFANKKGTYNRAEQVRSLVEREYFGQRVTGFQENTPRLTKWLGNLQRWSSRSSLLMNIPSDLKNQFSGYVQTIIESTGGKFITTKDIALSTTWAFKAMTDWSTNGIYTTGPGNLSTQLVQIFDPNFKSTDQYGTTVYRSMFKDLMNFEWTYMHRKFGEMDVAMRLFGAFLHGQKVERKNSDGSVTTIRYVDAWETDEDGIAKLKSGIHPGWSNTAVYHTYKKGETFEDIAKKYNVTVEELKAKNRVNSEIRLMDGQEIIIAKSENFKMFKNQLQGTSRALFGVYDDFGQPEGNKLLMYRMFFFMRKWFTPMLVNRFGMDMSKENFAGARYDWALGKTTRGYYVTGLVMIYRAIKSKGVEMQFFTDEEKQDFKKATVEGLMIISASILASMIFGYEDDDEDKWKKIKARSGPWGSDTFNTYGFLANHALYLLLGVQSETSAFVPLPKIGGVNLGADDYAKLITSTSTAFSNTVLTYIEVLGDILNFITMNDAGKYKRDTGPYWFQKKGEYKIYKRVFGLFGFSGGTGDPETLLKNLQKSGSRIR